MNISSFLEEFKRLEVVDEAAKSLIHENSCVHLKGLFGSFKSVFSLTLSEQIPGNHLFVLRDKESAAYFLNDLESLLDNNSKVLFYPSSFKSPYQIEDTDNANVVARAEVLERIKSKSNNLIVTYPKALFELVPYEKTLLKNTFKIEVEKEYSLEFLNEFLIGLAFERVDFVYEPGQFAIRGGILDVFSYSNENPYRIEFFGDEVESIRTFEPVSQLSLKEHQFISLVPNIQNKHIHESFISFMEFVGKEAVVWLESYAQLNEILKKQFEKAQEIFNEVHTGRTSPEKIYFDPTNLENSLSGLRKIEFGSDYFYKTEAVFEFDIKPQPSFNKNFDLLIEDLHNKSNLGYKNLIFSNQSKQIERLHQIFEDISGEVEYSPIPIALHEGFIFPKLKLVCYTDHQLFERFHRFRLKEGFKHAKQAITLNELSSLRKGDFVTHVDHGVGRFSGLQMIDVNGKEQEAIRLEYKDGDVLYVGVHSLHRISKFTGQEGKEPTLNKLGTQKWSALKEKTKKRIKELAFDLIKLYAKRKSQPGFSFAPDTYLQTELEASFMYEDTPDQHKATADVKADMESDRSMDRLICGDVGFGKTEVAIRAAFKAVNDSKQVAVLVPTTILSFQHHRSFKERLKDFPCNIDYINRFKSTKQVNETIRKLKAGEIDIIIGTHALVSDRIKFKDLGLMIIDEEQKFGVSVKDKLKTLRTSVDTLTLTATPIPRTLQFSLMGARDLSIINTPPPNRRPVLTEIVRFDEEMIRDAISYEVSRGGQVFFINNRLSNIKEIAGMISRLCPGIRVGIGHGQMEGAKLEKVMLDFIDGQFDVLISTTIVESGIDIANANTIIINDAHKFGLSDLHQLRGRVGRSNKKGFCYLISPPFTVISSESRKRLEALVQFSDLGSGFSIAMKDLDIRGAGNMLGGEQSGFIAEIGFEMYQKILNEALKELRENEFKELFDERITDHPGNFNDECVFETDLEVRIPDTYVNNVNERLSLYQELDHLKTREELENYRIRLVDRFGKIPHEVVDLLQSFELRWKAMEMGIERLVLKSEKLVAHFIANPQSPFYESEGFQTILNNVMQQKIGMRLSQQNEKLRLIIEPVRNINECYDKLNALTNE